MGKNASFHPYFSASFTDWAVPVELHLHGGIELIMGRRLFHEHTLRMLKRQTGYGKSNETLICWRGWSTCSPFWLCWGRHGLMDRMDRCIPVYVGLQSIYVNVTIYVCLLHSSSFYLCLAVKGA